MRRVGSGRRAPARERQLRLNPAKAQGVGSLERPFGIHRRRGPGTLEIGYWIHSAFLRQGLATSVAELLTRAALAVPGITRVEIHHDEANRGSAAIPRRLGYLFVGEGSDERAAPAELGADWTWRIESRER